MKLRTDSLRFRFIASTFLWIIVSLVLTGFTVAALFRIYTTQQFHDELQVHIAELEGLTTVDASGQPYLARPAIRPTLYRPRIGLLLGSPARRLRLGALNITWHKRPFRHARKNREGTLGDHRRTDRSSARIWHDPAAERRRTPDLLFNRVGHAFAR